MDVENRLETKNSDSFWKSKAKIWAALLLSSSLLVSKPGLVNSTSLNDVCPKGSRWTAFSLKPGEVCKGERFRDLCSECRAENGEVVQPYKNNRHSKQDNIDSMKIKVEGAMTNNIKIGKNFTKNDVKAIQEKLREWNKEELEKLIIKLNGNLDEEERTVFRGALEHWPEIKYHSLRLGIDPRISYLVAVAESRFVQKIGKSGELSPMQIMPSTMDLMFNRYGKNDQYIRNLIKEGKNWRKETTAQIILALYYLRDGISTVAPYNIKLEQLTAEELLMIYHFYNRGHNNYIVDNWWQGNNFATCVSKYLRLYELIENFIVEFQKLSKSNKEKMKKAEKDQKNINEIEIRKYREEIEKIRIILQKLKEKENQ